jgi:hypothetical protein
MRCANPYPVIVLAPSTFQAVPSLSTGIAVRYDPLVTNGAIRFEEPVAYCHEAIFQPAIKFWKDPISDL